MKKVDNYFFFIVRKQMVFFPFLVIVHQMKLFVIQPKRCNRVNHTVSHSSTEVKAKVTFKQTVLTGL